MMADRVRMEAYQEALRRSVRANATVVDLGTGTGILALLACQFGARRVYAIEPDDVIELAREIARANGYLDRIEFIQAMSTDVVLEERADVIVADLRGALPLFRHHIPTLIDARERLLAPNGVLIPERDAIWATVVEAPLAYRKQLEVWREVVGVDMEAGRRMAAGTWWKERFTQDQLLAPPKCWATLDYRTTAEPNVRGTIEAVVTRRGTAHGLGMWFDATLIEAISFSGRPGASDLVYGHAFFPFEEPVALAPGTTVEVLIEASLIATDYVWRWRTSIRSNEGDGEITFDQSTLYGTPLSASALRRTKASSAPSLSEQGRIAHFVLSAIARRESLGDIAQAVSEQFRHLFPTWEDAFEYVTMLSVRYAE